MLVRVLEQEAFEMRDRGRPSPRADLELRELKQRVARARRERILDDDQSIIRSASALVAASVARQ